MRDLGILRGFYGVGIKGNFDFVFLLVFFCGFLLVKFYKKLEDKEVYWRSLCRLVYWGRMYGREGRYVILEVLGKLVVYYFWRLIFGLSLYNVDFYGKVFIRYFFFVVFLIILIIIYCLKIDFLKDIFSYKVILLSNFKILIEK